MRPGRVRGDLEAELAGVVEDLGQQPQIVGDRRHGVAVSARRPVGERRVDRLLPGHDPHPVDHPGPAGLDVAAEQVVEGSEDVQLQVGHDGGCPVSVGVLERHVALGVPASPEGAEGGDARRTGGTGSACLLGPARPAAPGRRGPLGLEPLGEPCDLGIHPRLRGGLGLEADRHPAAALEGRHARLPARAPPAHAALERPAHQAALPAPRAATRSLCILRRCLISASRSAASARAASRSAFVRSSSSRATS